MNDIVRCFVSDRDLSAIDILHALYCLQVASVTAVSYKHMRNVEQCICSSAAGVSGLEMTEFDLPQQHIRGTFQLQHRKSKETHRRESDELGYII